jgi:macrolide transport system ATP-binding/permease protein
VLVCLIGGTLGVGLSLGIGAVASVFAASTTMVYSPSVMIAAVLVSSLIGIGFGFMPARAAARLDPVVALATE